MSPGLRLDVSSIRIAGPLYIDCNLPVRVNKYVSSRKNFANGRPIGY